MRDHGELLLQTLDQAPPSPGEQTLRVAREARGAASTEDEGLAYSAERARGLL